MALIYYFYILAKQAIAKQGPIPLALALILASTSPYIIDDLLRIIQNQLFQLIAWLQLASAGIIKNLEF